MLVVAAACTLCRPASSKIIGMKRSPPMIDSGIADSTWLQNHHTTMPMKSSANAHRQDGRRPARPSSWRRSTA